MIIWCFIGLGGLQSKVEKVALSKIWTHDPWFTWSYGGPDTAGQMFQVNRPQYNNVINIKTTISANYDNYGTWKQRNMCHFLGAWAGMRRGKE
jgi:hypothetical protein